ncbi:MaoC/PaaZ C-terminal domain-containing protein [Ornithinimicrobium faecis]|uniref:MaoC/PaaZ C-terminal domain-containing protein n=1 Tax=Ornithinimicrobium faecis TaxID=2934158 RepID=UPI0021190F2F|nr:MaoC/PaaZ C-terminal domain-containing protein [Ornithinimicrobium sp. HY1745]
MTVQAGQQLDEMLRVTDEAQMFLFCAATWNAHRIHYDRDWARHEGYPDLVVQGTLQGAWLADMAVQWAEGRGQLRRFHFKNRGTAFLGEELIVHGEVVSVTEGADGQPEAELKLWIDGPRGVTAAGGAVVALTAA